MLVYRRKDDFLALLKMCERSRVNFICSKTICPRDLIKRAECLGYVIRFGGYKFAFDTICGKHIEMNFLKFLGRLPERKKTMIRFNVEEKEMTDLIASLNINQNGDLVLRLSNSKGISSAVIRITKEGMLERISSVSSDLGLQLESTYKIKIKE